MIAFRGRLWFALCLILLAGCASPPRAVQPPQGSNAWSGRLALKVESDQAQSFSAGFDLKGDAQTGELTLYSPLGGTFAQLEWSPKDAKLRSNGTERRFESLESLVTNATGADIPIGSIFKWLAGENTSVDGWQADLRELHNGRLIARRTLPAPLLELRLVLE